MPGSSTTIILLKLNITERQDVQNKCNSIPFTTAPYELLTKETNSKETYTEHVKAMRSDMRSGHSLTFFLLLAQSKKSQKARRAVTI